MIMAAGSSGEWNVSVESVERLKQLAGQLTETTDGLAGAVSTLKEDFEENEKGLGAHSDDILSLIGDMDKLAGDTAAVVNQLCFKLLKAAAVRQSHIENSVYKKAGADSLGSSSIATGMAGAQTAADAAGGSSQTGQAGGSSQSGMPSSGEGEAGTAGSVSKEFTYMVDALNGVNVSYRPIEPSGVRRTTERIVERLSGGDLTQGSCSSLALAYAGNRAGYDVLDFRDGDSRAFFSSRTSIQKITELPGVKSTVVSGQNDIKCAGRLLAEMAPGKEYYLAVGQHASIVRRNGDHFEYLELQHPSDGNGWHKLDQSILTTRFGCFQSRSTEVSSFLMDVDSLAGNSEFLGILGYINTASSEQRKGVAGNVR